MAGDAAVIAGIVEIAAAFGADESAGNAGRCSSSPG
jgi:hypothetical protein